MDTTSKRQSVHGVVCQRTCEIKANTKIVITLKPPDGMSHSHNQFGSGPIVGKAIQYPSSTNIGRIFVAAFQGNLLLLIPRQIFVQTTDKIGRIILRQGIHFVFKHGNFGM